MLHIRNLLVCCPGLSLSLRIKLGLEIDLVSSLDDLNVLPFLISLFLDLHFVCIIGSLICALDCVLGWVLVLLSTCVQVIAVIIITVSNLLVNFAETEL
jgi:hypothetical protein